MASWVPWGVRGSTGTLPVALGRSSVHFVVLTFLLFSGGTLPWQSPSWENVKNVQTSKHLPFPSGFELDCSEGFQGAPGWWGQDWNPPGCFVAVLGSLWGFDVLTFFSVIGPGKVPPGKTSKTFKHRNTSHFHRDSIWTVPRASRVLPGGGGKTATLLVALGRSLVHFGVLPC
jgi:hypothetical protein